MLTKNRNGHFWHGKAVTAEEYAAILEMLRNPPAAPEGYGYRLTVDLRWELEELPAPDPDPELTAEEALAIMLGGSV
jgi:hypothetical protein